MTPHSRATLQFHFCVLLWGFTAILGKLISLPALALVCWRMLLVVVLLLLVPRVWRALHAMPRRLVAIYLGIGLIVALHWLSFYASIKLANASVGAICMALSPVFLTVVEPLLTRRRFDSRELLLALAALPGVALVVGGVPASMRLGFLVGAFSASLVAVFSTLNKRYTHAAEPLAVTFLELGGGAILMLALSALWPHSGPVLPLPDARDAILLGILAVGCTLLPFALSLAALRELSAFGAVLALNLEPVYSIVLAILLLGEQRELGLSFYAGVAIILGAVVAHPLLMRPTRKAQVETLAVAESHRAAE